MLVEKLNIDMVDVGRGVLNSIIFLEHKRFPSGISFESLPFTRSFLLVWDYRFRRHKSNIAVTGEIKDYVLGVSYVRSELCLPCIMFALSYVFAELCLHWVMFVQSYVNVCRLSWFDLISFIFLNNLRVFISKATTLVSLEDQKTN